MRRLPTPMLLPYLLAATFTASMASAKCAGQWAYSPHETTTPSGWLLVNGNTYEGSFKELATRTPRVVSGNHSVDLTVHAVHQGQFRLTQIVFKPSEPLRVGQTYKFDSKKNPLDRLSWKVVAASGGQPQFAGAPTLESTDRTRFGCGPAVEATIKVPTTGQTLGFLVELRPAGDRKAGQRFLLTSTDGKIRVGHGMCSGAYRMTKGERYELRVINLVSATGTTTPGPNRTVTFTAP